MKTKLISHSLRIAVSLLSMFLFFSISAYADGYDYMNSRGSYYAYASEADVIHFKIPVWAEGAWNYHMTCNDRGSAYIAYVVDKDKTPNRERKIAYFRADPGGDNDRNNGIGRADVQLVDTTGVLLVTSTKSGTPQRLSMGWTRDIEMTQGFVMGCPRATVLEMDWHIPEALKDSSFSVIIHTSFERCKIVWSTYYHENFSMKYDGFYKGQLISPMLFDPFLSMMGNEGVTGHGYAGIPYSVFYTPISYTTSLSSDSIRTSSRTGNIFVRTTDTIQPDFMATFNVYRNEKLGITANLASTKVKIPPYHRIHDFRVDQELDSTGTYTGNNILSWRIKNPLLEDIVSTDYFEIQRALKPDFSDAQQLGLEILRTDSSGIYSFADYSREIWTGHLKDSLLKSSDVYANVRDSVFIVKDADGKEVAAIDVTATCTSGLLPSTPVYYRMRRSSSSAWGWESNFAHKFTLLKSNYLAPLADTLAPYTKDPDYENNHKVNFKIKIDNKQVGYSLLKDSVKLDYKVKQYNGNVRVELKHDNYSSFSWENISRFSVLDSEGRQMRDWSAFIPGWYEFPAHSLVEFKFIDTTRIQRIDIPKYFQLNSAESRITLFADYYTPFKYRLYSQTQVDKPLEELIKPYESAIRDSLYNRLKQETDTSAGRCMWDRTAQLVLIRGMKGSDNKVEIIIPQDSIKRQPDGSWIASYFDIADQACTDYTYAVRIDDSKSDLRFQNPKEHRQAIALTGPSLYFDEGADIDTFTASMLDARGERKKGVMLDWRPTNSSVDEYLLLRKAKGSDASPDTIYRGIETTYFDLSAVPNRLYEYTVVAMYDCNGKRTVNSRSADGRRSPYGEIGGTIMMIDNCGMSQVTVSLQQKTEGGATTTVKSMITSATGSFLFDSISYDISSGTSYEVVPTHQYGIFSYNHTSASTASIGLSSENAVVKGLLFENTSVARLSGRVLYENTTIPVPGAMFLLNGDTVRRGNVILTSGNDGNFEMMLSKNQTYTLQIIKPGHTFKLNGYLQVEQGKDTFALTKPLDGVRFYDQTKVRLIGRVAGGNDQRDLRPGFGLGTNNLGDNLQLVLQLEGDNTAHIIHDPQDLTRDTIQQNITLNYKPFIGSTPKQVTTHTLFEKKRITIHPDAKTGEFAVDLCPAKYKLIQATAQGYATLFAPGQGSEIVDLINSPLTPVTDTLNGDTIHYHAIYNRIYHTPVQVTLKPMIYGIEQDGYGEPEMEFVGIDPNQKQKVKLWTTLPDGSVSYTLGYPIFLGDRKYQFEAKAYEEYYYNNNRAGTLDRVPWRGGKVKVRNGLHSNTETTEYTLDNMGSNRSVWLMSDYVDVESSSADGALRAVSVALESEGNTIETNVFRAFVAGWKVNQNLLSSTDVNVNLLDIVRDPGGANSSAYVASGATYNFSYDMGYRFNVGFNLTNQWGLQVNTDVGIVSIEAGTYSGSHFETKKGWEFTIPIVHGDDRGSGNSYSLSTRSTISTSSSPFSGVGSQADVFIGTMVSCLSGKVKSLTIISDSLYQQRQPAIQVGKMLVLAHGVDADGNPVHLVTGEKLVVGSSLSHDFAYSQKYVLNTILPRLVMERQDLLRYFNDSTEAQSTANALGEPVYWYRDTMTFFGDTLPSVTYSMIPPENGKQYVDRVEALNRIIRDWINIIIHNEKEKIYARICGRKVGAHSLSSGVTQSYSENYSSTVSYNYVPQAMIAANNGASLATQEVAKATTNLWKTLKDFVFTRKNALFGDNAGYLIDKYFKTIGKDGKIVNVPTQEIGVVSNVSKHNFYLTPVLDANINARQTISTTQEKSTGYTLSADPDGELTVSVYRANLDSIWADQTLSTRTAVSQQYSDRLKYGSLVFYTDAGATYCPHQDEERTMYYQPGTLINNATLWIAKPELSANTYEITNVPADKRAVFKIVLNNGGQMDNGPAEMGAGFNLGIVPDSNPDGAKVYIDGGAVISSPFFWINPGQPIVKTLEIERGTVDDYNLSLSLWLADCPKQTTSINLSVHFLPVSSDVNISMPRQNWVMNTLSPHDSIGYYLPITIDGFDVQHKNFDHIEFQYKTATQSEDNWVTYCSFYANDTIYEMATGNKAMIRNGVITPFRFYGEKDPIEQRYDLRAVSFCRYGSGFVTKSSPVISGTKDTRPPRVFGEPEPANSILGVGDYLQLKFNENIAGNYLDEDNNFQVLGYTNASGISATTSLHFSKISGSSASTKVNRVLSKSAFTIDMMVRLDNPYAFSEFFTYGKDENKLIFGLDVDSCLYLQIPNSNSTIRSARLTTPLTEFTRLAVVVDKHASDSLFVKFYIGNEDVTNPQTRGIALGGISSLSASQLVFGSSMDGDMLEARVWSKALTPVEITTTNSKYLTGYELELLAYYRMNDGVGTALTDRANGATLYLTGCKWNVRKGISLAVKPEQRVRLDGNIIGRSTVYDGTYALWFMAENTTDSAALFSALGTDNKHGLAITFHQGVVSLRIDSVDWPATNSYADGEWHHVVLSVNRVFEHAALYVDSKQILSIPASVIPDIVGAMYLGGGWQGLIDDFSVWEQALPESFIHQAGMSAIEGDEMGLMAFLPFEQQILNASGVLETVFSGYDQRLVRQTDGSYKTTGIRMLLDDPATLAHRAINAPTVSLGKLTKLKFDWSFHNEELIINILNHSNEINKQSMFITVRDVEDLNGNPMPSPAMWTVFVDRNNLKWSERSIDIASIYGDHESKQSFDVQIVNTSGKRHNFTIESLPEWLTVNTEYGIMKPQDERTITFTYNTELAVGTYSDVVYLIDEDGLSEPLTINYEVIAIPPYEEIDKGKYPLNMSICGVVQLTIDDKYIIDINDNDIVYALYNNECVGMANLTVDKSSNRSEVFLTVYGNADDKQRKDLRFQLWLSSTGYLLDLQPDIPLPFAHGHVFGCSGVPVLFTTTGAERQTLDINKGWGWYSFNLYLQPDSAKISKVMSFTNPWSVGDLIKNPTTNLFLSYSAERDSFAGDLKDLNYRHIYMIYSKAGNTMQVNGNPIPEDSMTVVVMGNSMWNPLPCLFNQSTSVTEALSDYYQKATTGDMIKSHDRFATFTADKRWVGDLVSMHPGEGYLFRRTGPGNKTIHFYNRPVNDAPSRKLSALSPQPAAFSNPSASSNMTMIAEVAISDQPSAVSVYANGEKVGEARPIEVDGKQLYFLTIQYDQVSELTFETEDGDILTPSAKRSIIYEPDSHYGSVESPVVLLPGEADEADRARKVIEEDHLFIYRNGHKYDATGYMVE